MFCVSLLFNLCTHYSIGSKKNLLQMQQMKKNLFYYLFTVICSVTLFASCSDDDEKVVNPVPQTTFTGENGLQLTYNGAPMLGKKVTFTPDEKKFILFNFSLLYYAHKLFYIWPTSINTIPFSFTFVFLLHTLESHHIHTGPFHLQIYPDYF